MGRLWQTLILQEHNPLFAYIPVESVVKDSQQNYYAALAKADAAGDCTSFIEFMVAAISRALADFYRQFRSPASSSETRLAAAQQHFRTDAFQRRDYMHFFKTLSQATASRDLRAGTDRGMLRKTGDKRLSVYRLVK